MGRLSLWGPINSSWKDHITPGIFIFLLLHQERFISRLPSESLLERERGVQVTCRRGWQTQPQDQDASGCQWQRLPQVAPGPLWWERPWGRRRIRDCSPTCGRVPLASAPEGGQHLLCPSHRAPWVPSDSLPLKDGQGVLLLRKAQRQVSSPGPKIFQGSVHIASLCPQVRSACANTPSSDGPA